MAVRPLIRPRPRVIAPAVMPGLSPEALAELPRVLSRVKECYSVADQPTALSAPRQPAMVVAKQQAVPALPANTTKSEARESIVDKSVATQPKLPAFWQSRKVLIAASVLALVSAITVGYQFRPKQQIIVVHPAKPQNTLVATPTKSLNPVGMKPAFQPLSPATFPATNQSKETTSTASLIPGATWPAAGSPAVAQPAKNPIAPVQTAIKPTDTRTSSYRQPATSFQQESLPQMSSQFLQAPNPTSTSASNASIVYNPTMNVASSPLASNYAPQNNQSPQNGSTPQYTASRPNFPQNMQPSQPLPPQDGSMGAYGSARFEGQINPLPLLR